MEEAIVEYDKVLRINPKGEVYNLKGLYLVLLGRYEEAIVSTYQCFEDKPKRCGGLQKQRRFSF